VPRLLRKLSSWRQQNQLDTSHLTNRKSSRTSA
jgi:hypothetical protein